MMTILKAGVATCIKEPRGQHGLEGYNKGDIYHFQLCAFEDGEKYVRVYPAFDASWNQSYYETCGTGEFKKFFEEIEP